MNIDNDYDNDGNNIVPCPICLDVYCPSKENGKCPEEDMFALEGEIRMLLDEYKATDDNSRIANVLEAVEKILHHQLQKAREDGYNAGLADGTDKPLLAIEQGLQKAREESVKALKVADNDIPPFPSAKDSESARIGFITGVAWARTRLHSELDQDKK